MAVKITDLNAGNTPIDTDLLETSQAISTTPVSRKISFAQIAAWIEATTFTTLKAATLKLDFGSGTHNLGGDLLGITIDGGVAGGGNLDVFNVVTTDISNTVISGALTLSTASGGNIILNPGSGIVSSAGALTLQTSAGALTLGSNGSNNLTLNPGTTGSVIISNNQIGSSLIFTNSNPTLSTISNNPLILAPGGSGIILLNAPVITSTTLDVTGDINIINTHIITNATGMNSYQSLETSGTITQSGTTVTGSGTTFTAAMVGGLFIPASGTPCIIKTFTSTTSIIVSVSQTIAAPIPFSIGYGGLQFDNLGNLSAGSTIYTPLVILTGPTTLDLVQKIQVNGDTNPRLQISSTGVMEFGIGSSTFDTVFARTGSGTMTISDSGGTSNGTLNVNTITTSTTTTLQLARVARQNGLYSAGVAGYSTGTIAQSGTAVTGTSTVWIPSMVGGILFYSDGSSSFITAVNSNTSITVDTSKPVTAGATYTIFSAAFQASRSGNIAAQNIYLPTSGGTPSPLNFYQGATNITASWTGAWSGNSTLRFTRIGNKVSVMMASVMNTAGSAAVLNAVAATVPTVFIPTEQQRIPFYVRDNTTDKAGLLTFNTDGSIEISAAPAQDTVFAGSGSTGWFSQSVGWNL